MSAQSRDVPNSSIKLGAARSISASTRPSVAPRLDVVTVPNISDSAASMPRVSDSEYLIRHRRLRALWGDVATQKLFGLLSVHEQQQLHAYYHLADDLTDEQLLAHRRVATAQSPSLPSATGKHYKVIYETFTMYSEQLGIDPMAINEALHQAYLKYPQAAVVHADPTEPVASRRVMVTGIARPELDYQKLAYLVLAIKAEINHSTWKQ